MYFSRQTGNCQAFLYRGLRGNSNNYPTLKHCQVACMGQVWSNDLERLQLSGAFLRDPFPYGVLLDQNIPVNQLYNGYTIVPYGAGAATLPPNVVTISAPVDPLLQSFNAPPNPSTLQTVQLQPSRPVLQPQIIGIGQGPVTLVRVPYDPLGIRRPLTLAANNILSVSQPTSPLLVNPFVSDSNNALSLLSQILTRPNFIINNTPAPLPAIPIVQLPTVAPTAAPQPQPTQRPTQVGVFNTQPQQPNNAAQPCVINTVGTISCPQIATAALTIRPATVRPAIPFPTATYVPPTFAQPSSTNTVDSDIIYVPSNPCCFGTPAVDDRGYRYTCDSNRQCPPQYWCHLGASVEFNACCYGADNPCMQEMRPGSGPFVLARWYYDRDRARCIPFTYRGLFGTANNFLTRQQCEQACTAVFEPQQVCQTEMLAGRACVSNEDCPVGFWCHIGISQVDNRCCRVFDTPQCQQPVDVGTGNGAQRRWYMDLTESACGTCKPFTYRGLYGNQNNFRTRVECEASCSRCGGLCDTGQPLVLIEADGTPTTCNSQTRPCPRRYYCREGPDVVSAVCCPDIDYAEILAADKRDKQNVGVLRYAYVMPPVGSQHQQQAIDSLSSAIKPAISIPPRNGQQADLTRASTNRPRVPDRFRTPAPTIEYHIGSVNKGQTPYNPSSDSSLETKNTAFGSGNIQQVGSVTNFEVGRMYDTTTPSMSPFTYVESINALNQTATTQLHFAGSTSTMRTSTGNSSAPAVLISLSVLLVLALLIGLLLLWRRGRRTRVYNKVCALGAGASEDERTTPSGTILNTSLWRRLSNTLQRPAIRYRQRRHTEARLASHRAVGSWTTASATNLSNSGFDDVADSKEPVNLATDRLPHNVDNMPIVVDTTVGEEISPPADTLYRSATYSKVVAVREPVQQQGSDSLNAQQRSPASSVSPRPSRPPPPPPDEHEYDQLCARDSAGDVRTAVIKGQVLPPLARADRSSFSLGRENRDLV